MTTVGSFTSCMTFGAAAQPGPMRPATGMPSPFCMGRPEIGVGFGYAARAMPFGSSVTSESDLWQCCVSSAARWNRPAKDPLQEIVALARQSARERKGMEEQEFLRLRGLWLAAGGECVSAGSPLVEFTRGEQVVRGGALLYSELWGEIDLSRLNQGLSAYHGERGQADLARDLAFATGRFAIKARKVPAELAQKAGQKKVQLMRDQGWKQIAIDWRRAQYLLQVMNERGFETTHASEAGYDRFAEEFFLGDAAKAYQVASSLLSKEAFAVLGWGKQKLVNVKEQAAIREALASGEYQGEAGYDRFALEFYVGNAQKAHLVASALLSREAFVALGWGKQKQVNVGEQTAIRKALASGAYQDEAGYDRFAEEFFQGDSVRAYIVASALLSREAFASLGWGKAKLVNVKEQTAIREELASGAYQGEAGYDRFALEFFLGNSAKAYSVVSALLSREAFAALGWGKKKQVNVQEQAVIRKALASGAYQDEAGYDRFAMEFYLGNAEKAYRVASALLSRNAFSALRWGKAKKVNVKDQAAIRGSLACGDYQGEAGYDRFALEFFLGDLATAYHVASALLSDEAFSALGWGKLKQVNVKEQAAIRAALASGDYQGEAGYDRFALEFFLGGLAKAYHVASALLTREAFAALGWGKAKQVNVKEQAVIRAALASGDYQGEAGYDRVAEKFFLGNSQKAYLVASALLSREAFAALGWGKQKLVNVKEQVVLRAALKSGKYSGQEGRKRFMMEHFSQLQSGAVSSAYEKAFRIASALLQDEPHVFQSLGWRSTDQLNDDEIENIRTLLSQRRQ